MFAPRLHTAIQEKRTPAVVGLDPRWESLPSCIRHDYASDHDGRAKAYARFCCEIIDVIEALVPAVKPQSAFFEECGPAGVDALRNVIRYARSRGLIVICDAKRGDIGSTAEAYAKAYLAGEDPQAAPFAADALTVNPYMGTDTLAPFIKRAQDVGAGLYVLVRTSNPGAGDFQDLKVSDNSGVVFEHVAKAIEQLSHETAPDAPYGLIGAVSGATYPDELKQLREMMPHVPLLIPGYGSQGGTSADVAGGFDSNGLGAVVNSSRGIIFSYKKEPYAIQFGEDRWMEAVEQATKDMIADLQANTPASEL